MQLHQARAEKVLHCCQLSYTFKNKCVFLVMVRVQISRESKIRMERQRGKVIYSDYRLSEGSVLIKAVLLPRGKGEQPYLQLAGEKSKEFIPHGEQVRQPSRDTWDTQGMSIQHHLCDPARQGSSCIQARAVSGSPPALFACNHVGGNKQQCHQSPLEFNPSAEKWSSQNRPAMVPNFCSRAEGVLGPRKLGILSFL